VAVFEKLKWKQVGPTALPQRLADAAPGLFEYKNFVPAFPPEMPAKERAIQLLRAASEVEHQFIVQYLYALYCGAGEHASALLTIAKEEMGHLITVQNLLAILGEPPYLGRIGGTPEVPEPVAFSLEPFQISFIARFLVAESAESSQLPADIEQRLPPDLDLDDIYRVGALYQAIYWLFQDSAAATGPWNVPLGADLSEFQELGHLADADLADPVADDWGGTAELTSPAENVLVMPAPNWGTEKSKMRAAALKAIHAVAAQGEGPVSFENGTEPAHAERLRSIYDVLATAAPGSSPYPVNPFVDEGSSCENGLSGDAAVAARALDKEYERALLTIALAVVTMPDGGMQASEAVFTVMPAIDTAARRVARLPRRKDEPTLLGGPPFTFPALGIPANSSDIQTRLTAL